MKTEVGERVVAISNSNSKEVEIIGRGVYLGESVPDSGEFASMGLSSAKIMIDDTRDIVWGIECIWMSEKRFDSKYLNGRRVIKALPSKCA